MMSSYHITLYFLVVEILDGILIYFPFVQSEKKLKMQMVNTSRKAQKLLQLAISAGLTNLSIL